MNDIVHRVTYMQIGVRYMLILKHHFERPDKVGILRLSKQMVNTMVVDA